MMTMTFLERLGVQWMAMECAIAANVPEFLKLTNHYLDNTIYAHFGILGFISMKFIH